MRKTQRFMAMALAAAALTGAACASTNGARSETTASANAAPAHQRQMGMMAEMCPMQVPGTTATAADVEGGVAISFTTTRNVNDVRQRVRRMAEMHNRRNADGMMMEHPRPDAEAGGHKHEGPSGGMMSGGGMMMMPAATATVGDIEGGARLVLRPKDPAQLGALREHARMHTARMAGGECPMMSQGPAGRRWEESMTCIDIPDSVRKEHQEIHAALTSATKVPGRVGEAARDLARLLEPHFLREEQVALPPLGLLRPLANGEFSPSMTEVLAMTDALRSELPQMLREHVDIASAARRLEAVAGEERNLSVQDLARKLQAHAKSEEEVFYPAAILVGLSGISCLAIGRVTTRKGSPDGTD